MKDSLRLTAPRLAEVELYVGAVELTDPSRLQYRSASDFGMSGGTSDGCTAPSAAHQIVERPHRLVDGCVVIPAVHPVQVDVRLSIVVAGTSSRMM